MNFTSTKLNQVREAVKAAQQEAAKKSATTQIGGVRFYYTR
jgi:outer membrane murein-binding lipoprotein Lpp